MRFPVAAHARKNLVGYLALFISLGGTAWAAATIGAADIENNAVRSRHIRAGEVKASDIDPGGVQSRVKGDCAEGLAIRAIAEGGDVACEAVGGGGGGGTPSGPAGGALSGTYPDPGLAAGAVAEAALANEAVTTDKIAPLAITGSKIFPRQISSTKLASDAVDAAALGPIAEHTTTNNLLDPGTHLLTANCASGEQIISGGFSNLQNNRVLGSFRFGNGWRIEVRNGTNQQEPASVHAYCLDN